RAFGFHTGASPANTYILPLADAPSTSSDGTGNGARVSHGPCGACAAAGDGMAAAQAAASIAAPSNGRMLRGMSVGILISPWDRGEGSCRILSARLRSLAPPYCRIPHAEEKSLRGVAAEGRYRPYTACSVTTKSMRPSLSARAHSAGALTIGSSCTLKLVLTRTGRPVL